MSGNSVNWLLNRVNSDISKFFEAEHAVLEDSLRQQEALRHEVHNLEDRCIRTEQELQMKNSRLADVEAELERTIGKYKERVRDLEFQTQEDARTILAMRDTERTLRSEVEQLYSKTIIDDRTINELKEVSERLLQENELMMRENSNLEETCRQQDLKLRRMLDDVVDEISRLRGEVDRQRRDLEPPRDSQIRELRVTAGRDTTSIIQTSPRSSLHASPYSPVRSPSSPSMVVKSPNREVNVVVQTQTPFSDISYRLDSLHQKLKGLL